jgi:hypothetical protein
MRRSGSVLALLAWVAGSAAIASEPKVVALGRKFSLRVGESAQVEGEGLEIGFESVVADSRCPKGEQCIREGEATIRVWLRKAPGARETQELHVSSEDGSLSGQGYELRALRLDPYPISGKATEASAYSASLEVARAVSPPEGAR